MKRRIIRKFRLAEISAVDKPCCEDCTIALVKRDYRADERKMDTVMDREPTGLLGAMAKAERAARSARGSTVSEAGQLNFSKAGTAYDAIMAKARAMHRDIPELSIEQCFKRIYEHPSSTELRKAERADNRPGNDVYEGLSPASPIFDQPPAVERDMAFGGLKALAARIRSDHPFKTAEQLYVEAMRLRPDLARREREASRRALGVEV